MNPKLGRCATRSHSGESSPKTPDESGFAATSCKGGDVVGAVSPDPSLLAKVPNGFVCGCALPGLSVPNASTEAQFPCGAAAAQTAALQSSQAGTCKAAPRICCLKELQYLTVQPPSLPRRVATQVLKERMKRMVLTGSVQPQVLSVQRGDLRWHWRSKSQTLHGALALG